MRTGLGDHQPFLCPPILNFLKGYYFQQVMACAPLTISGSLLDQQGRVDDVPTCPRHRMETA